MDNEILEEIKLIITKNIIKGSDFEEVAYYCLTSKSELHFRNIIAFQLYKNLKDKYHISREWNNCDLAILDKQNKIPKALIEFKLCYSCDLYKKSTIKEYTDEIKKDFIKSRLLGGEKTEIFSILFIVKPKSSIPKELKKIVKYLDSINTGLKKLGAENLEIIGEANLRNEFDEIEFFKIKNDFAFGIECELGYCIIKN